MASTLHDRPRCEFKSNSCVWIFGQKESGKTRFLLSYLESENFVYFDSMNQIGKIQFDLKKKFPKEIRKRIKANSIGPERWDKDRVVEDVWVGTVMERARKAAYKGENQIVAIDEWHYVAKQEGADYLNTQLAGLRTHGVGVWGMSHRTVVMASQTVMDLVQHIIVFPMPRDTSRRHDRREIAQITGREDIFETLESLPPHSYAHYVVKDYDLHYHGPVDLPGWLR